MPPQRRVGEHAPSLPCSSWRLTAKQVLAHSTSVKDTEAQLEDFLRGKKASKLGYRGRLFPTRSVYFSALEHSVSRAMRYNIYCCVTQYS